ncbi:MAG TPA: hypothetical protein VK386_09475 [Acidimicrobiales bacterium]|nr:hypothetical protein [Acidimicrobiales bacterium]
MRERPLSGTTRRVLLDELHPHLEPLQLEEPPIEHLADAPVHDDSSGAADRRTTRRLTRDIWSFDEQSDLAKRDWFELTRPC